MHLYIITDSQLLKQNLFQSIACIAMPDYLVFDAT